VGRTPLGSIEVARAAVQAVAGAGGLARGVYTSITVTVEGMSFDVIGVGSSRIAVLGSDGVIYKAPHPNNPPRAWAAHKRERELFDASQGESWCPDYQPYDECHVMAMRRYSSPAEPVITVWPLDNRDNFGTTEDGRTVLIDGGDGLPLAPTPVFTQPKTAHIRSGRSHTIECALHAYGSDGTDCDCEQA